MCGDVLAEPLHWAEPLEVLRGKPAQLEFTLHDAALFGFELSDRVLKVPGTRTERPSFGRKVYAYGDATG